MASTFWATQSKGRVDGLSVSRAEPFAFPRGQQDGGPYGMQKRNDWTLNNFLAHRSIQRNGRFRERQDILTFRPESRLFALPGQIASSAPLSALGPKPSVVGLLKHVRSGKTNGSLSRSSMFQMSTFSAMLSVSSSSTPRYRTLLSTFVCPNRSCAARRLPVLR